MVVVVPPSHPSMPRWEHQQQQRQEQSNFTDLALRLSEAYETQQQGVQTVVLGYSQISNGLLVIGEALGHLAAFAGMSSTLETESD